MNIVKPLFVILFIFLLEISMAVFIFTYFKDTSSKASVSTNNIDGNEVAGECENCTNSSPATPTSTETQEPPIESSTNGTSETTYFSTSDQPLNTRACKSEACKSASALKAHMDLNVDPCEDFYRYSCGGWLENTHLPYDSSMIGSFLSVRDKAGSRLKDLLSNETLESDPVYESVAETYYSACMNTGKMDERGAKPLLDLISSVGGFPVINSLWRESDFNIEDLVIKLYEIDLMPFMSLFVDPFARGPKKMFSLDFPYHIYTARNDADQRVFMTEALKLLGADVNVLKTDFEEINQVKGAIMKALYNQSATVAYPLSIDKLQEKYNWLDWLKVLKTIAAKGNIVIESTDTVRLERDWYFNQLSDILNSFSKRALANYMMSCLLTFTDLLDYRFRELNHRYPTDELNYRKDRWKTCVALTENKLPEAVGRIYVNKYLRKEDRDYVAAMSNEIKASFHEILHKNTWLSNQTKARAKSKLSAMGFNVGYPESLLDDDKLNLYYSNIFKPGYESLEYFELCLVLVKNCALEKINILVANVDYQEKWPESTSYVNAFYQPGSNSMYILAGVLEEPAYYAYGTSSMKYGGIGSIIGHEISHGFDTQGSQFDEIGERNNWWTWYDRYIYLYLASCYALQYNDYKWDGHQVDGYKTLDENIADNTGLEQTYRAYRKWVKIQGAEEEQLPDLDLTHDQIFFVSYAQLWCTKVREEVYQHFINHERHSHGNVRVQGPISNSQYFARAFNCKINSTMNPEKKCFLFDMYN